MDEQMKIYTQKEIYEQDINTDMYELMHESGEHVGVLRLNAWTSKARKSSWGQSVRAFVDLVDGSKIIALVQSFRPQQIATISVARTGCLLRMVFETSSSGQVFLSELEVLLEPEEMST